MAKPSSKISVRVAIAAAHQKRHEQFLYSLSTKYNSPIYTVGSLIVTRCTSAVLENLPQNFYAPPNDSAVYVISIPRILHTHVQEIINVSITTFFYHTMHLFYTDSRIQTDVMYSLAESLETTVSELFACLHDNTPIPPGATTMSKV